MTDVNAPVNITGFADWAIWTNEVTQGYFGVLLIFAVFIIGIISLNKFTGFREALLSTTFFCVILSIFLRILGVLTDASMWITVIILGLSTLLVLWIQSR